MVVCVGGKKKGHLEVIVYSEFHIKHRCDGTSKITSAATVLRGKRTRPEAKGATIICTCEIMYPEDTGFILRTIFEEENGQIRDMCRIGAGMLQSLNPMLCGGRKVLNLVKERQEKAWCHFPNIQAVTCGKQANR